MLPSRLLLPALLLCSGPLAAEELVAPPFEFAEIKPGPADTAVRKLQIEKYNTLRQVVDLGRRMVHSRRVENLEAMVADTRDLVEARLVLTVNPVERVRTLESGVTLCRWAEDLGEALRKAGRATEVATARYKVARLDMEIRLAQAKQAVPATK